jgi:hypothetical protein
MWGIKTSTVNQGVTRKWRSHLRYQSELEGLDDFEVSDEGLDDFEVSGEALDEFDVSGEALGSFFFLSPE